MKDEREKTLTVTNRFKMVAQDFSTWALLTFRARLFFVMKASYSL